MMKELQQVWKKRGIKPEQDQLNQEKERSNKQLQAIKGRDLSQARMALEKTLAKNSGKQQVVVQVHKQKIEPLISKSEMEERRKKLEQAFGKKNNQPLNSAQLIQQIPTMISGLPHTLPPPPPSIGSSLGGSILPPPPPFPSSLPPPPPININTLPPPPPLPTPTHTLPPPPPLPTPTHTLPPPPPLPTPTHTLPPPPPMPTPTHTLPPPPPMPTPTHTLQPPLTPILPPQTLAPQIPKSSEPFSAYDILQTVKALKDFGLNINVKQQTPQDQGRITMKINSAEIDQKLRLLSQQNKRKPCHKLFGYCLLSHFILKGNFITESEINESAKIKQLPFTQIKPHYPSIENEIKTGDKANIRVLYFNQKADVTSSFSTYIANRFNKDVAIKTQGNFSSLLRESQQKLSKTKQIVAMRKIEGMDPEHFAIEFNSESANRSIDKLNKRLEFQAKKMNFLQCQRIKEQIDSIVKSVKEVQLEKDYKKRNIQVLGLNVLFHRIMQNS